MIKENMKTSNWSKDEDEGKFKKSQNAMAYIFIYVHFLGIWKTVNWKFSPKCWRDREDIYQLERYYCM